MHCKHSEALDQIEFEISEEVMEKMHAQNGNVLIEEQDVSDLHYIDVSGSGYLAVKRIMDVAVSFCALLAAAIPMAIIALVVFVDDPGRTVFQQYRVGRDGKRFKLYKFRTMKMNTPKYLSTMEMTHPEEYITRVGRFLRKSSLDELPQLINVLKGDMSMIGPRPLISDEYEIHRMRARFGVYQIRPGITGLAQINGRDTVSPVEKVHWDVMYLENLGLWMDLKILFATVPKVFGKKDVVEGAAGMNGRKRAM